ncbi:MAG: hypothetical protein M3Y41_14905 [Pseudomonadota bacterium]|nr:hypothetical protein [Pseudomonadota bacterium]
MLALIQDPSSRSEDAREADAVAAQLAHINAELERMERAGESRADMARHLGHEIAAAVGLAALAASVALAVLA